MRNTHTLIDSVWEGVKSGQKFPYSPSPCNDEKTRRPLTLFLIIIQPNTFHCHLPPPPSMCLCTSTLLSSLRKLNANRPLQWRSIRRASVGKKGGQRQLLRRRQRRRADFYNGALSNPLSSPPTTDARGWWGEQYGNVIGVPTAESSIAIRYDATQCSFEGCGERERKKKRGDGLMKGDNTQHNKTHTRRNATLCWELNGDFPIEIPFPSSSHHSPMVE